MTVKHQLKILDRKIKQKKADCDLYRQNAEISALISGDLNKYEYLTNKDLGYKPDPIQKAKSEYRLLGQEFNKGLDFSEKQEGLLKKLKNVEDKTDNQLRAIEGQKDKWTGSTDVKKIKLTISYDKDNEEAINLYQKIKRAIEKIRNIKNKDDKETKFNFSFSRNDYDFHKYTDLNDFATDIQKNRISLNQAIKEQEVFYKKYRELEDYTERSHKKDFEKVLKSVKIVYDGRHDIIDGFDR